MSLLRLYCTYFNHPNTFLALSKLEEMIQSRALQLFLIYYSSRDDEIDLGFRNILQVILNDEK